MKRDMRVILHPCIIPDMEYLAIRTNAQRNMPTAIHISMQL